MMTLINFCNTEFIDTITCSTCESEGYGVRNLISSKEFERNKGFLVDHFIRPPVTININFVCEIRLNHVLIWPRVGGQKSSGIELLTSRTENDYNSVTSGVIKNEVGFLFCKYGYKNVKSAIPSNFLVRTFKSDRFLLTKCLQIRVFKTWASSAIALQKIEIWGELCKSCPTKSLSIVSTQNCLKSMKCIDSEEGSRNDSSVSRLHIDYSQAGVTDEFIDPITNEIMVTPIILPSGNIIDNQTLEKYINEESKWGRLPSDPFTGKLFSATNGPKLSVPLKARLDKFLLENCEQKTIKDLARTLGSVATTEKAKTSCLVSSTTKQTKNNFGSMHWDKTSGTPNKKQKVSEVNCILDEKLIRKECASDKLNTSSTIMKNKAHFKTSSEVSQNYEVLKQQSLDDMLKSTLSSLPCFTKCRDVQTNVVRCERCNLRENLYQLPCKHCICKLCLSTVIENNSCKCNLCLLPFRTADPKRVHLV